MAPDFPYFLNISIFLLVNIYIFLLKLVNPDLSSNFPFNFNFKVYENENLKKHYNLTIGKWLRILCYRNMMEYMQPSKMF